MRVQRKIQIVARQVACPLALWQFPIHAECVWKRQKPSAPQGERFTNCSSSKSGTGKGNTCHSHGRFPIIHDRGMQSIDFCPSASSAAICHCSASRDCVWKPVFAKFLHNTPEQVTEKAPSQLASPGPPAASLSQRAMQDPPTAQLSSPWGGIAPCKEAAAGNFPFVTGSRANISPSGWENACKELV